MSIRIEIATQEEAMALAEEIRADGAEVTLEDAKGLVPLSIAVIAVVPAGLALLANVVNRIVVMWKQKGIIIDARGTGSPTIKPDENLPGGTVIVLTRDGDTATRSEIPKDDIGAYLTAALNGVGEGLSASEVAEQATEAIAQD